MVILWLSLSILQNLRVWSALLLRSLGISLIGQDPEKIRAQIRYSPDRVVRPEQPPANQKDSGEAETPQGQIRWATSAD